jgi:hypothetical protein
VTQEESLQTAHQAPRCTHVRVNGQRCGSPALRNQDKCYYHQNFYLPGRGRSRFWLATLEDSTSIQCCLANVMQGIIEGSLEKRRAQLLLYGIKLAIANRKGLESDRPDPNAVVVDIPDHVWMREMMERADELEHEIEKRVADPEYA